MLIRARKISILLRISQLRVLSPRGELCFGPVLQPAAWGCPWLHQPGVCLSQPPWARCPQPVLGPSCGTQRAQPCRRDPQRGAKPHVGPGAVPPPAALAPMPRSAVTPSSCSRFGRTRCRKREVSTLGALFLGRNSRLNADKSQQDGCGEGVRGRGKEAVPCSSSPLCPAQPQPAPFGSLHPRPAAPQPQAMEPGAASITPNAAGAPPRDTNHVPALA